MTKEMKMLKLTGCVEVNGRIIKLEPFDILEFYSTQDGPAATRSHYSVFISTTKAELKVIDFNILFPCIELKDNPFLYGNTIDDLVVRLITKKDFNRIKKKNHPILNIILEKFESRKNLLE